MNVILQREDYLGDGIFGKLFDEAGNQLAVTLEHAYESVDSRFVPKLAAGEYTVIRHAPNRLPYETFMVTNVPNFQDKSVDGILIHIGNYNPDSEGCILLGKAVVQSPEALGTNMIIDSRVTFAQFMRLQDGVDSFKLTVKDKA
jgi:Family of unknown function (DUF5675)